MRKNFTSIIVLAVFLLMGCATTGRYVEGVDFDETKRTQIIKGESTKEDVLKIYGEPMDKGIDEKYNEFWSYFYVESSNEVNVWTYDSKGTKRIKKLIIVFDDKGKVRNYVFSDSTNPVSYNYNAKK